MEASKEHIATLCAFSTVGIAAAGLALGSEAEIVLTRPGKRKAPGADIAYSSDPYRPILNARRTVSQPADLSSQQVPAPRQDLQPRSVSSLFRRKTLKTPVQTLSNGSQLPPSRGSSISRQERLRSFTLGRDGSAERDGSRPLSSWFSRVSGSLHSTSPAPSTSRMSEGGQDTPSHNLNMPNRLVKRATSQKLLSSDTSSGSLFKGPSTSHQRSASLGPVTVMQETRARGPPEQAENRHGMTASAWRPFFTSGYSRKRHVSGGSREAIIRTVSAPYSPRPTLVNGHVVQSSVAEQREDNITFRMSPPVGSSSERQRDNTRRSVGSLRRHLKPRNFTDPTTQLFKENANGSVVSASKPAPISPISRSSTFNYDYVNGSPIFMASPSMHHAPRNNFIVNKRTSVTPSEPNTASSGQDTGVFTDDDSMDFPSDTAYDSLATRATASSHSGFRQPKIQTIFDEPSKEHINSRAPTLEALMQQTTIKEDAQSHDTMMTPLWVENVGIGIHGIDSDHEDMAMLDLSEATTPVREQQLSVSDELNATPVAKPVQAMVQAVQASSPSSVLRHPVDESADIAEAVATDMETENKEVVEIASDESIDWSPKSDPMSPIQSTGPVFTPTQVSSHPYARMIPESASSKRSSIFDWSEQSKNGPDTSNGVSPRPKTVHGKQGQDHSRSRAAGRKDRSVVHLRSQSVPVHREVSTDLEPPPPAAKFGTWGLGHKPVSEEWGDDFEFDDVEEIDEAHITTITPVNRNSVRSVKVPQAIIDRQASVHLQFGQVQEFMLLVEELKRLRAHGMALNLLQTHSKETWDDAENIINLATLNEEDHGPLRPPSPTASDIFGEDTSPEARKQSLDDTKPEVTGRLSFPGTATPPTSRARGDSLAQARDFLQAIHQNHNGRDSSPAEAHIRARGKMPFGTQHLRTLVDRAGEITRALKEVVRKAEGVSISPQRPPRREHDPSLSHIFTPPEGSPCPPFRKPGIPKSHSANSYLGGQIAGEDDDMTSSAMRFTTAIEAN